MSSSPGYQARPASPRVPAGPTRPMVLPDPLLWTTGQLLVLAVEVVAIVVLFGAAYLVSPEEVALLWRHPTGVKLLMGSAGLLALNFGVLLAVTVPLNRCWPAADPDRQARGKRLFALLVAVLGVLFYVPALTGLVLGPVVLQIMVNIQA